MLAAEGWIQQKKLQALLLRKATAQAAIPEGTVISDGKLKINLAYWYVLLYGQVPGHRFKSWPYYHASWLSSRMNFVKKLIKQAAPGNVKANVVPYRQTDCCFKRPTLYCTHVWSVWNSSRRSSCYWRRCANQDSQCRFYGSLNRVAEVIVVLSTGLGLITLL